MSLSEGSDARRRWTGGGAMRRPGLSASGLRALAILAVALLALSGGACNPQCPEQQLDPAEPRPEAASPWDPPAGYSPVEVTNGSFEEPAVTPPWQRSSDITVPGWNGSFDLHRDLVSHGAQAVDLNQNARGEIRAELTLPADSTCILRFFQGLNGYCTDGAGFHALVSFFNDDGTMIERREDYASACQRGLQEECFQFQTPPSFARAELKFISDSDRCGGATIDDVQLACQAGAAGAGCGTQFGVNAIQHPLLGPDTHEVLRNDALSLHASWDRWVVQWYWVQQPWYAGGEEFKWKGTYTNLDPPFTDSFGIESSRESAMEALAGRPALGTLVVFNGMPRRYNCIRRCELDCIDPPHACPNPLACRIPRSAQQCLNLRQTDPEFYRTYTECSLSDSSPDRVLGLSLPPDDQNNRLAAFVRETMEFLSDRGIRHFQTWNEPDGQWQGFEDDCQFLDPDTAELEGIRFLNDYLQMVDLMLSEAKKEELHVILGAPASPAGFESNVAWHRELWKAVNSRPDMLTGLRAVALHSYGWPFRTWTLVDDVRAQLTNRPGMPIWVTESGLGQTDGNGNVDEPAAEYEVRHGAFILQEFVYAKRAGVAVDLHFNMESASLEHSLYDSTGTERPASKAALFAGTYLSDARPNDRLSILPVRSDEETYMNFVRDNPYTRAAFTRPNGSRVTVLWANQTQAMAGSAITGHVPKSGLCALLYGQDGQNYTKQLRAPPGGSDYELPLQYAIDSSFNKTVDVPVPLVGGFTSVLLEIPCSSDTTPPAISAPAITPLPPGTTATPTLATAPSGTVGTPADNDGWYREPVEVSFDVQDPESRVLEQFGCGPTRLTRDTAGIVVTCSARNAAELFARRSVKIRIDRTPPVVAITNVQDEQEFLRGSAPTPECRASDALSGLAGACTVTVSGGTANGVGLFTATATATDVAGNVGTASARYRVVYPFGGFRPPVANPPTVNVVNGGAALPVKFSLGGVSSLDVFAPGSPRSRPLDCASGAPLGEAQPTEANAFNYDAAGRQYVYVWKTRREWEDTCRQLQVGFDDGKEYTATVRFR